MRHQKVIIPANIHAMLTGAVKCITDRHTTRLIYSDGSEDHVRTHCLKNVDWENWFSIVSSVQDLRKSEVTR